jgi:hypothetical protein
MHWEVSVPDEDYRIALYEEIEVAASDECSNKV